MQKVLILGAGKIGALISGFLAECRDYEVHVADVNGNAANSVVAAHGLPNLHANEFDASDPALLEAHLLDFAGDLYGEHARVQFTHFLRSERKFDGIDALIGQLKNDIDHARTVLAG